MVELPSRRLEANVEIVTQASVGTVMVYSQQKNKFLSPSNLADFATLVSGASLAIYY